MNSQYIIKFTEKIISEIRKIEAKANFITEKNNRHVEVFDMDMLQVVRKIELHGLVSNELFEEFMNMRHKNENFVLLYCRVKSLNPLVVLVEEMVASGDDAYADTVHEWLCGLSPILKSYSGIAAAPQVSRYVYAGLEDLEPRLKVLAESKKLKAKYVDCSLQLSGQKMEAL